MDDMERDEQLGSLFEQLGEIAKQQQVLHDLLAKQLEVLQANNDLWEAKKQINDLSTKVESLEAQKRDMANQTQKQIQHENHVDLKWAGVSIAFVFAAIYIKPLLRLLLIKTASIDIYGPAALDGVSSLCGHRNHYVAIDRLAWFDVAVLAAAVIAFLGFLFLHYRNLRRNE